MRQNSTNTCLAGLAEAEGCDLGALLSFPGPRELAPAAVLLDTLSAQAFKKPYPGASEGDAKTPPPSHELHIDFKTENRQL
jgi:hypothetical protein